MEIAGINIKEGNKIIAEFMGYKYHPDDSINGFKGVLRFDGEKSDLLLDSTHEGQGSWSAIWHRSWDALMPVVERIESLHDDHHGYFGVHISSNSCSIQGTELWRAIQEYPSYGYVYASDPNAILNTKIESTWYNVVKFIQWYNSFSAEKKELTK